jgi:hypothetical protein
MTELAERCTSPLTHRMVVDSRHVVSKEMAADQEIKTGTRGSVRASHTQSVENQN